jgi:hypothetical protein
MLCVTWNKLDPKVTYLLDLSRFDGDQLGLVEQAVFLKLPLTKPNV